MHWPSPGGIGPVPEADGHDEPRLVDEAVPGVAAVIDDVGVGGEHAARQPVVAQKLPDGLDRVQFGRSGWQQHKREVVWHDEVLGAVPSGPGPSAWTPWAPGATACATSAK